MVIISALQKIIQFVEANSIGPMKIWSERVRFENDGKRFVRSVREIIKKIRQLLSLLSGGEIVEMLLGFYFDIFKTLINFNFKMF